MKKTIVLGITSGIAAFKSLELVQLLRREDVNVHVVMTESATRMVSVHKFEQASGNKVHTQLFEKDFSYKTILKNRRVEHIDIADAADVVAIVPATANIIAKLAHGIADDFLTTTVLATTAPVVLFPSMNVHMYENTVVGENIEKLRSRGFFIFGPDEGNLACGYRGKGRLPDVVSIKNEIVQLLKKRTLLQGKRVLVTAGGTQEKIDDVRFITNKSSGKMGVAIAEECFLQGAEVLLLRSINSVESRFHIPQKTFSNSEELEVLVQRCIKTYDVIFHTAAVSDFNIKKPFKGKVSSKKKISLELVPAKKIINSIKKVNPNIFLVAFKAEYGLKNSQIKKIGMEKIQESHADAVVLNEIGKSDRGFGVDTNEVFVVRKNGSLKKIPISQKRIIAQELIQYISPLF